MFSHEFVRNAYLAGSFIAVACGLVGWFVVLRAQVFAGDALSHVAFVGAIAALVLGLDARIGLFGLTLLAAFALAGLGRRAQADDVAIGTFFAWVLGLGILLITLLASSSNGGTGVAAVNTLFGSIYSLSAAAARLAAVIGAAASAALLAIARPLLLSTLDPELAVIRGIPVRILGALLLAVLAVVTAESAQAVGTLLVLGLLAAPAAAAHRLTANPYVGLALSAAFALSAMWGGLALAYAIPSLPPSTAIIALAAAWYAVAALARMRTTRTGGRSGGSRGPAAAGSS